MERRVIVEMNNQSLVSVPVITYNSSKFVLETLESIKSQTYQNIELIISDDCSTDNTVELCQNWVKKNKERFVHTRIITSETNTGVSANLNRAEAACQGEWIKGIAGDDLLMPRCIELCVEYIYMHPDVFYLFGKIQAFGACKENNELYTSHAFDYSFFDLDVQGQLDYLIFNKNCIPAATFFYNRQKSFDMKIFNDERIPLLEDWPKWIKILEKGEKLHFMDDTIVKYRLHKESLSTKGIISVKYLHSNLLFDLLYRYPRWEEKYGVQSAKMYADYYAKLYSITFNELCLIQEQLNNIKNGLAYRLGKKIVKFFKLRGN